MVTKNTIAFLLVGAMFTVISTKIIGGHDVSIKSGDLVKLLEEMILSLNKTDPGGKETVTITNETSTSSSSSKDGGNGTIEIKVSDIGGEVSITDDNNNENENKESGATTASTTTTPSTTTTMTTTPTTTTIPWVEWDPRAETKYQYRCRKRDKPEAVDFCAKYCATPDHLILPIIHLFQLMHACAISCRLCGQEALCKDRDPGCKSYRMFCNRGYWSQDIQKIYCGKTCGYCD